MLRAEVKERLQSLQKNRANIRNICILAHVDHGKTTLADSLVASNGIISQRQAGKLRYLDSRKDEQLRGITMKSSAIALQFTRGREDYLINLIDSPGHVDFSSEVSTAVRLCDGAIVVVDAVEGVCPQTQVVLQQAWVEGIKPCLVLNKIDRLVTELKYTPTEAHYHLQQVLEQVNAVTGALFTSEVLQAVADEQLSGKCVTSETTTGNKEEEVVYDWSAGLEERDDSSLYFSPEHNNVIFASALDGWGFGVSHFAELYAKKLGIQADTLRKTLWGDFFLNTKTKRIHKGAQAKGKKPLFVQFVLENMWAVYDAVLLNRDKARIEKIVSSMNLSISARDSRHTDSRIHLFAICSQWLPLATSTLGMVVDQLPNPLQLTPERVEKLMCSSAKTFDSFPRQTQLLKEDFIACSPDPNAPTVVFISKLFVVDSSTLPQHQARPLTQEEMAQRREAAIQRHLAKNSEQSQTAKTEDTAATETVEKMEDKTTEPENKDIFLAFSRVYSGTIRRGQNLFVLHPRYDPREVDLGNVLSGSDFPPNVSEFTVGDLYILMGREVMAVEEVPAGNIVGIAGLEELVLKSATVASSLACPAFRPMSYMASPIVHVAIEPVHASDMPALVRGMKLLNQADPCVEVMVQETGEHILSTAGEVHLQKCLDDLRDQYSRVELNVSAPIIPFRETVISPPKIDMVNEAISSENEVKLGLQIKETSKDALSSEVISIQTANRVCTLQILAKPLLPEVTQLLKESSHLLRALNLVRAGTSSREEVKLSQEMLQQLWELKAKLHSEFVKNRDDDSFEWEKAVDSIWSFGPRNTGPNILLNGLSSYKRPSVWSALEGNGDKLHTLRDYDSSIVSGFQLATLSGPLCEEPMHGLCFILKEWTHNKPERRDETAIESEHTTETDNKNSGRFAENRNVSEDLPSSPMSPQPQLQATDVYGPFSGQLMSAMKEGCRKAFLAQPARLMAAMYTCDILATAEVLGKLYAVLGRRNGQVLAEEMKEGSAVFSVQALVPVAESFGFAEEVRKKTSGLASPQLVFSHWELISNDPFWVPSTEEELLHFGEKADSENIARRYMNTVRKRKGLPVEEKIVEHAEKQRTLKKNK